MEERGVVREWTWLRRELRPFLGMQLLASGILVLSTLLSLVDPLIMKWLIDSGLQQGRWSAILTAVAVFCIAYFGRMALTLVGNLVSMGVVQRATLRLRLRLLRKLHRMDAGFFDKNPAGDLVHRIEQDVEQVGQAGADIIMVTIRIFVSLAVTLGVMAYLDWRLTCFVIPFLPVFLVLRNYYRKVLEGASDAAREAVGTRTSFLNEGLNASLQLQLLGAEHFFRRKYGRFSIRTTRAKLKQARAEILYTAGSFAILILATGLVLVAGAYQYLAGSLTLGGYIAFYTYAMRLFDPLGATVEAHARLKRAGGSIRRIADLEQIEPQIADCANPRPLAPSDVTGISCRDLSFSYADGRPVFRNVDLQITRGEKLALVGRSGMGKSTLAKLLTRLYEPAAGGVSLAGVDVRSIRLRHVRDVVSLVPHNPVLFRGTLRENALLGTRGAPDGELTRLARIAGFAGVVERNPEGWDRVLGAGGAGLSDGEKQRLGLLRALLRDRPVLILDEATGALDPMIENEVLSGLAEYTRDKAVLFITHRLSAACWAERIVMLRDGQLWDANRPEEFATYAAAVGTEVYSGTSARAGRGGMTLVEIS
jgi:ABC-type multidrug transport system fused ATPase/permease subunit